MKIYISADIEGTAGATSWSDATIGQFDYVSQREQMTREVLAACEGAIAAGASEIVLKDAHDSGRNIALAELPECVRIVRGWSGHPYSMVQELDESFDALVMIGYHSPAGSDSNPLAHTINLGVQRMRLNGEPASEFLLHALAAATCGVPVVFVSGDLALCRHAEGLNRAIRTVAVLEGVGASTISMAPSKASRLIGEGVQASLAGDVRTALMPLAEHFTLEVEYNDPVRAHAASWYPGCRHVAERTVRLDAEAFLDVMRALRFIL